MKWTDENIDKLFQESAAKESFVYRPEYWEEFNAALPDNTPLSQASDEIMDAAFQSEASKIELTYKDDYWKEFSDSLPVMVATEDIADAEVDAMYRDEAAQLSFEYHPSYWEEMASLLRRRRRRPDFIWFGLSGAFAVVFAYLLFVDQSDIGTRMHASEMEWQAAVDAEKTLSKSNPSRDKMSPTKASPAASKAVRSIVKTVPSSINRNASVSDASENTNAPRSNRALAAAQSFGEKTDTDPIIEGPSYKQPKRIDLSDTIVIAKNATGSDIATTQPSKTLEATQLKPLTIEQLMPETDPTLLTITSEQPKWPKAKASVIPGLYIQGVGGLSQSSITPSEFVSSSYGLGAGFIANKNRCTFSTGVNLLVENFNDLHLTRSAKVYGFGADLYQFDLFYKRLYTVEFDLHAGYTFGRHEIRLGIRPSYAFSSLVDVSETSVTTSQGQFMESSEERTSVFGFMEGIQQWGLKPSVGYAFHFPSDWTVGVNVGAELLPAINEDFINGVNNQRPIDGQLYLRKTLRFKR